MLLPPPTSRKVKVPLAALSTAYVFPGVERGEGKEGMLGVGADLEPGTVLTAYHQGIFPWPANELGEVFWCSPDPRAVYLLAEPPRWSRSLRRALRLKPFVITIDRAFDEVMAGCAEREGGTWITPPMRRCYRQLHDMGWAHSLEVWSSNTGNLVGGIYGIELGASFTAESMFHRETDASKVAFASLVERLRPGYLMLDAEVMSPHLRSLGCVDVPRSDYLARLAQALRTPAVFPID